MCNYVLRTNRLSKIYKTHCAVDKVSMHIREGDIYGLIGKNGAGKTTLMRLITGLTNITGGNVELYGIDTSHEIFNARKRMGTLIETPAFYPDMTAYDNMEFLRIQKGIPGRECIKEKLDLLGLGDMREKKVKDFSLGMKQRLGLAMALLGDPDFLILDEPTNGLDPIGALEVRNLLERLNRENNVTILISSHVLSEVHQLANCYGIINDGRLVEEITQVELDEKCNKFLEIKVNDTDRGVWVMENILKTRNYKVSPTNYINIYEYIDDPGIVSQALVKENIIIEQISVKGNELENYFMNSMGGKNDD